MTPLFQPGMHRFAVFTAACTLLLVVAGALVTSNDAGLAVPDWPLSYGTLAPPMVGGIFYEHGHRMAATFVGILAIVQAVWLWRRDPRRWMRRLGLAALGTVIAQGVLGGLAVILLLPTAISVAHASLAQLFFCATVSIALCTSRWWHSEVLRIEPSPAAPVRMFAVATAAAIFLQLILGAAFRHNGIGIVPHLVGAGVVATLAYRTRSVVRRSYPQVGGLCRPAGVLAGLVTLQLVLGAAALWARIEARSNPQPMPLLVGTSVLHVVAGAMTLAAAIVLGICAFRILKPAGEVAFGSRPQRAAI